MTHEAARILLAGYTAGELDFATAGAVRGHLASGCRECLRVVLGVPARRALPAAPEPRIAPPTVAALPPATLVAPAARRTVAPLAVTIGLLTAIAGIVLFSTRVRDARVAAELRLMSGRLADLDFDRADLSARLAAATRELDDARNAMRQGEGMHTQTTEDLRADRRDPKPDAPPRRSAAVDPDFVVHYDDDTLSVRVVAAPLADILRAVSAQSGIAIRGQLTEARTATIEFDRLPFPKALRRLLRDQNFKLVYEAEHHPRLLELLSAPGVSTSKWMMVGPAPGVPSDGTGPAVDSNVMALAQQRAVPVAGALAETHATGAMTLQQLIDTGVLHADPAVRAQAWRAAVNQLQNDPELRSAITGMLGEPDDASLGDFVLGIADDRAQEALFYLATQAHGSALRDKAAALLHDLQMQSSAAPATRPPGG